MKLRGLLTPVLLAIVIAVPLIASAQKDGEPASAVSFVVIKDENGKPVRNAAVILHPVGQHGKQAKTGFELKADDEGKTHFDGIPYGKWRVQVIAPGYQTFGDDYSIQQTSLEITIRLKRPQGQYSIYESHDGNSGNWGSGNSGSGGDSKNPPPKQ